MKSIQALIFDLDDTLMDTFGQLVPEAHRQACLSMQKAGLEVPLEHLLEKRWALIKSHPREEVNRLLAYAFECRDEAVIQAGIDTYFNPFFETLEPFPGVYEMLDTLRQDYALFLLTSGIPEAQQRKVEALNLSTYFNELVYAPLDKERAKYKAIQDIVHRYHYRFDQTVVIGDRINNEIVAGNQLGCYTIWIQQGECLGISPEEPEEMPHLTTSQILDVPHLLTQL
jgi:FMN phosphatase YigB (HAD superfamily)